MVRSLHVKVDFLTRFIYFTLICDCDLHKSNIFSFWQPYSYTSHRSLPHSACFDFSTFIIQQTLWRGNFLFCFWSF